MPKCLQINLGSAKKEPLSVTIDTFRKAHRFICVDP